MADASVRPAHRDDAAEIGRIQVETWRAAYTQILPQAALDALTEQAAAAAWAAAIETPPTARHRVLVALEGQWLVGFVASGPAEATDVESVDDAERDGLDPGATIVVGPLLVEPRWGRRGHGSRLLAATVDLARADAMTGATAWIPEADRVTRDFLTSAGWAPDGLARALDTGAGELREIRVRSLLTDDGPR